jgi:hypothetical protein
MPVSATSSLIGSGQNVEVPDVAQELDWEAELAVVIGRQGRDITPASALDFVAGYANVNDISSRNLQLRSAGGQWTLGKALDGFAPMGPWLVAKDEVSDPQSLKIRCEVDGVVVQDSSTAQMIFGTAELIAYLSKHLTLLPGDVIATGTPAGVAMGRTPPPYLQSGAEVTVAVRGASRTLQHNRSMTTLDIVIVRPSVQTPERATRQAGYSSGGSRLSWRSGLCDSREFTSLPSEHHSCLFRAGPCLHRGPGVRSCGLPGYQHAACC